MPKEPGSVGSHGAGVTGGCEPLDVDSSSQTQVLWRDRTCSQLLSSLQSCFPEFYVFV